MLTAGNDESDFPPFSGKTMTPRERRCVLLRDCDVVLDVGAHTGEYGTWLRSLGYAGRIISFEPLPDAFATLAERASHDPHWECRNVALGAWEGEALLHVTQNSIGSSVYPPTRDHLRLFPAAAEVGQVTAKLSTLALLWPDLRCAGQRVYLHLDVQGGELSVLAGSAAVLAEISLIELQMSLMPMNEAGPLLTDLLPFLSQNGYRPVALEPNHGDDEETGQMMRIDGVFARLPQRETR